MSGSVHLNDVSLSAGKYSPFYGFCRMMSHHANVRDGGSSVDGMSRAGLNKLVGTYYQEGMRKPARNGNPGDLDCPGASKLARHFLRARWRDPEDSEDLMVLQQMFSVMQSHEVDLCLAVLRDFSKWRPGPAGRGGDRASTGVRSAGEASLDMVDTVLRNVRQRIEVSKSTLDAITADDDDDVDDEDNISMQSTVVQSPHSVRPSSAPAIDRVQLLQGLIDEIRNRNMSSCNERAPDDTVSKYARSSQQAFAAHNAHSSSSRPAWLQSTVSLQPAAAVVGTSSADLLNSLFRQVACQQESLQASAAWSPASTQALMSHCAPAALKLPSAASLRSSAKDCTSQPPRGEVGVDTSCMRVQALCQSAAAAACPQDNLPCNDNTSRSSYMSSFSQASQAPLSHSSISLSAHPHHHAAYFGGGGLTLPPLKAHTVLPSLQHVLRAALH